ncbi:hypothetical protein BD769DRAFT_1480665 [Suillus cothurnatus]|nr:hypothetical protein BD769DRAFT_1480665 [Suillus cothurnatus]
MGSAQNSSHAVHSRRVSSVGGYDNSSVSSRPTIILSIGCLSGVVFGGIHCLNWNVLFQDHIMWRVASLVIVSAPVSTLLLWGYGFWVGSLDNASGILAVIRELAFLVPLASFFIYIVARIVLIALILTSFQSLPPGTYDTVAWSNFIPHL